jgi:hypothetical protein
VRLRPGDDRDGDGPRMATNWDLENGLMPTKNETTGQKLKRLVSVTRFRPGVTVKYLVATKPEDPSFMKTLALAQLLSWMILDQQLGRRTHTKNGDAVRPVPNWARVGNHVLALLLHVQSKLKRQDETTKILNELLAARGGVGGFAWTRGSYDLYQEAQKATRALKYVYWTVNYLCRCKKYDVDASKFNIESSKVFLNKWAPEKRPYSASKIEKAWLKYKDAAPYIFAFYGYLRGLRRNVGSPLQVLAAIESLASNEQRLKQLIGRAAYAADILNELAHDVRLSDFNEIVREEPRLRPFTEQFIS